MLIRKLCTLGACFLSLSLLIPFAHAQRGGRGGGGGGMQRGGGGGMQRGGGGMQRGGGGGGMQRGGGGMGGGGGMQRGGGGMGGGGGMQRGGGMGGGGFSGGMSAGPGARGPQGPGPSMGPYGHGASSAARPGMGSAAATRPGMGAGGVGGPDSGIGVRPGAGAGRPGVGAGGVGGPDSGIGVRPGAGAGRPGVGYGGVGGPDSGRGVLPGAGYGAPGAPAAADYAARRYGTYYADDAALVAQRNTVIAASYARPPYNPAMYAGAWQAANMMNNSYYANPGYGAVAGMMGMPAQQPMPYDYGANVVAQPTSIYINGDSVGTPQAYAAQAGQIAQTGASAQPDPNDQWLPLGVYAMAEPDQSQPNDLFQLAVNKQGLIRGNYHNIQTNETIPLAGSVDLKTQRAAWTIGGDQTPVYEAGIANLTRDQSTMLVHTPDGQQKQFNLVRLPDPQPSGGNGGGDAAPNAPPAPAQP